jgi:cyclophilin family peptidyl-prolyl cis-trans isomerase
MGTDKRNRKKQNRQLRLQQMARQSKRRKTQRTVVRIAIVLAIVVSVGGIIAVSGNEPEPATTPDTTAATSDTTAFTPPAGRTITGPTPCPAEDGSEERVAQFEQEPPTCIEEGVVYSAIVDTNKGAFTIELDAVAAPLTVNNFVVLARYKYFDSTSCHRAIPNFVVQCGDPTATGTGGPGYQFADELPQEGAYQVGSIAMANSGPNTNGSQFFVITGSDGAALPPSYSLFGQVTEGLDTTVPALDAAGNPADNGVPPLEQLLINSVTIVES